MARLDQLRAGEPSEYQALLTAVAGGYLLDADVRRRLGYPGQVARVLPREGVPAYVEEGLLDHLLPADGPA